MNKMRSILLCLSILGCLLFNTPLWAAADPVLDEIKALVESYYLEMWIGTAYRWIPGGLSG